MLEIISKVFGTKNERELKQLMPLVEKINGLEPSFEKLSDEEIQNKTPEFKDRIANGESLDDLMPEAFAAVREAAKRVLGMRHYDVQLLGGIVLHRGCIAEMKTGEGKTLTATLPVYLNALPGKGVHVVTVNDYLAKRDAEWMGKVYNWLGLSVGNILSDEKDDEVRRAAYQSDITYGTNNEMGFDYLRDNMKFTQSTKVQRGFFYGIVDEVDSVLVDEARTPLIIAGPTDENVEKYYLAETIVNKLKPEHYTVDEKDRLSLFTEEGIAEMEKQLKLENLYDPSEIEILHCLEQSLKAHHLFKRDTDYLIKDNQVVIIDENTGRLMQGRRYSDGLHQALEAKEGVKIERQTQTLASVTFQNFFRMYEKLSGMTGTAETEAAEFLEIYKLKVYVIPSNRPLARLDRNDQIYRSGKEKYDAIIDLVTEINQKGQPVLIGTIAVETSEYLSGLLSKRGIKHTVLNAKFHEQESEIVAQAGRLGAVTIATNMAGRGTDIVLGGNPEMLAKASLRGKPQEELDAAIAKYSKQCAEEKQKVLEAGGLAIVGTERHDSRRIDNQLRGRAGRQGDPGFSRFYLSLEDKLMRLFGNDRLKGYMKNQMEEGKPIEHKWISRSIEKAQKNVEQRHFEYRKNVLEYDDVMNKQRNTFYGLRAKILESDPRAYLFERLNAIVGFLVEHFIHSKEGRNTQSFEEELKRLFQHKIDPNRLEKPSQELAEELQEEIKQKYKEKWDSLGILPEQVEDQERFLVLYVLDQQWKDHMRNMDALRDGISLHGYAQKDPKIEYKKQSFAMFNELMDRMDEEVVRTLVLLQPKLNTEGMDRMRRQRAKEQAAARRVSREENQKPKTVRREQPKIGRNEPCHCGSGKKYKHCHGRKA